MNIKSLFTSPRTAMVIEKLVGKSELYRLLNEGLEDAHNHQVMPAETIFEKIERELLP